MLFEVGNTELEAHEQEQVEDSPSSHPKIQSLDTADHDDEFVLETLNRPENLGIIHPGRCKHYYYSSGAFNLIQLCMYILKQIGPSHLFLATYSIADRSIQTLIRQMEAGNLLSVKFLVDNRVRTISPKPYDFMLNAFPGCTRCRTIHAKVALLWNQRWQVDVVGSQNATHNPKLERGTIITIPEVFAFDKKTLDYEFEQGTTDRD